MKTTPLVLLSALFLTACSSGDSGTNAAEPAPDPSDTAAGAEPGDGPLTFTVNGETMDLTLDICSVGGAYGDDDTRQMSAVGDGGFPSFSFDYIPTVSVSAEYTDADGVERYRSNDEGDFGVTVTDTGAQGTVTLRSQSGQADDVTVEFSFSCPEVATGAGTSEPEPAPQATKTGYVEWAGARSDLDTEDFDPFAGTGLCETQDVTGTEGDDYYRIVTKLDDGTSFSLTSDVGLVLGETLDPIDTSGLEVNHDGRTVSGSATTPDGALTFSFTC